MQDVALETGADLLVVAAAIASLVKGDEPVPVKDRGSTRDEAAVRLRWICVAIPARRDRRTSGRNTVDFEDDGAQVTYQLDVGKRHGVQPGNIVGAIANEAQLDASQINGVDIRAGLQSRCACRKQLPPERDREAFQSAVVCGQPLNLKVGASLAPRARKPHRKGRTG